MTRGDTWDELIKNIYVAVEACLSIDLKEIQLNKEDKIIEVAV
jgi:predicted RNase H-like HicB family nuclease